MAALAATGTQVAFLNHIERIRDGLIQQGFAVIEKAFPIELSLQCQSEIELMHKDNVLVQAAIQSGIGTRVQSQKRSDLHAFLTSSPSTKEKYPHLSHLCDQLQQLRIQLSSCIEELEGESANRCTFMCAKYPKDTAGYIRHRDAKPKRPGRKLTCLCYFNNDWVEEHGGQLRIWPCIESESEDLEETSFVDISPLGMRIVIFRSSLWHQVFPTRLADRYALTAWMTNTDALAEEIVEEERDQLKQKLLQKAAFLLLKRRMSRMDSSGEGRKENEEQQHVTF